MALADEPGKGRSGARARRLEVGDEAMSFAPTGYG